MALIRRARMTTDAVYAAARDLRSNGAEDGKDMDAATFSYNHSETYVAEVLDIATSLAS